LTGFGTVYLDLENDGDLDLVTVNGAVRLIDELIGDPLPLAERPQLFVQEAGRFAEVDAGPAFSARAVGRGLAKGDVDNDGDLDLLIGNNGGAYRLLLNEAPRRGSWLGLRLLSRGRDALGARVRLLGRPARMARVGSDGSYSSAHDPRLLFGLGAAPALEAIEVSWPDGQVERFAPPALGAYTTLRQGSSSQPDLTRQKVRP
jgi:hypothetical protein